MAPQKFAKEHRPNSEPNEGIEPLLLSTSIPRSSTATVSRISLEVTGMLTATTVILSRLFDRLVPSTFCTFSAITRLDLSPCGFNPAAPLKHVGHEVGIVEIHHLLETSLCKRRNSCPPMKDVHQEVGKAQFLVQLDDERHQQSLPL